MEEVTFILGGDSSQNIQIKGKPISQAAILLKSISCTVVLYLHPAFTVVVVYQLA